jgi:hypothetical protein
MITILNYGPPADLSGYTSYTIEVIGVIGATAGAPDGADGAGSSSSSRAWRINKRFSDFVTLDTTVRAKYGSTGHLAALPSLPSKQFFGRFDPTFLEKRCQALQSYLTCLCGMSPVVQNCTEVRSFLEVPRVKARNHTNGASGLSGLSSTSSGIYDSNGNPNSANAAITMGSSPDDVQKRLDDIVNAAKASIVKVTPSNGRAATTLSKDSHNSLSPRAASVTDVEVTVGTVDEDTTVCGLVGWKQGNDWVLSALTEPSDRESGTKLLNSIVHISVAEYRSYESTFIRGIHDDFVENFDRG